MADAEHSKCFVERRVGSSPTGDTDHLWLIENVNLCGGIGRRGALKMLFLRE